VSLSHRIPAGRFGRLTAFLFAALFLAMAPSGAGAAQKGTSPLLVTWETADGSTFNAVVTDPESIARIEAAFPGDGQAGIPNGTLVPGDGDVNAPHAWHLVDVVVVDITIELCDATATMVDEDLDYWLNTVGSFCPWTATVIATEPYDAAATPAATPPPDASPGASATPADGTATTLPDTGSGASFGAGLRSWPMAIAILGLIALGCGLAWSRSGTRPPA
jgi:hypothetical protein